MDLRGIATGARVELLEPFPQRPSRRYLLQLATSTTQNYMNRISNTGRPWSIAETLLVVSPNVIEYLLPVDNISKIQDVTTVADNNDSFIEWQVPFFDFQDLRHDWNAPANLPAITFYDATHTARRIAFYRKNWENAAYCSVWPIPQFTASYRVLYSVVGNAPSMSLDQEPILTQFHNMLVTKTAVDALPGSAWWQDEDQNRIRRKELAASFASRLPEMEQAFNIYVRSLTTSRMTRRLTYSLDT